MTQIAEKLAQNNRLLHDVLGEGLFKKIQRRIKTARSIDQILNRIDLEMGKIH